MHNKKIIAVSATQGTGKSSTVYGMASFLKRLGKNVAVINELARECPFPINQVAENRTQTWIATKQILTELNLMDRYEYVIADRSVIDPICYSLVIGQPDWISNELTTYLSAHIKRYYKKLYLLDPQSFNYNLKDGVRDNDELFRQKVHDKMVEVFEDNKLEYTLIHTIEDVYSDLVRL